MLMKEIINWKTDANQLKLFRDLIFYYNEYEREEEENDYHWSIT